MKHAYLSERVIDEALKHHLITKNEATKLQKKVDCQSSIVKIINKQD